MADSYICNTSQKTIGRSAFSLNAKKCPKFKPNDILYMSDLSRTIHSRWVISRVSDKIIEIVKNPTISISVSQESIFPSVYTDKYSVLSPEDSDSLERHFNHQIKIFPAYDYQSKSRETNTVLTKLKELDLKAEVYPDAISNEDVLNGRLPGSYSVLILDNFGVITFKCINEDPANSDQDLKNRFTNQVMCNDTRAMLSNSPQLTDNGTKLTINHINAIIYETTDLDFINLLNSTLSSKNLPNRVFTADGFIDFIRNINGQSKIVDDIKRIGIIQSLLPKFINSKTVNIADEALKFIPSDTFELDDIQKEILKSLDQRTFIKASAGSGKTILLLAKAYEVAVANPKKKFLLLCLNNKLAEDIRNQAINTGRNASNLRISTFDKFLMDENIPYRCNDPKESWEARKSSFVELVLNNKISYSFGGIFVDEVQQMKEEWLSALLRCTDEQKYMIVSGDYYQSINPSLISDEDDDDEDFIEEGDTSDFILDGYKFETIILDKNYRNTRPIAKVLDKMVSLIHETATEIGLPNKKEKVLGHAYKDGIMKPYFIRTTSGKEEVQAIIDLVESLVNQYDCAPSDILIVSPQKNYMTKFIVASLEQRYNVCNFTGSANDSINTGGIKIGSIGKSIGLDFKAVIFYNTEGLKDLRKIPSDFLVDLDSINAQSKNIKRKFLSTLRNVYVACSRAREILIILDDTHPENLFTKLLRESGLEEK